MISPSDAPLLPESAGCPQCGSTSSKRWRSYSGVELCTDCEMDFLGELNGRKLLDAQQAVLTRAGCASVGKSRGAHAQLRREVPLAYAGRTPVQQVRVGGRASDNTTRGNSQCLLCGHIWYGRVLDRCLRCRGACTQRTDRDLTLMCRYAHAYVEGER